MRVTKRFTFDAAHVLPFHQGKCKRLHGHTYSVEVSFEVGSLDENGMGLDFDLIGKWTWPVINRLDHQYLNELTQLGNGGPLFPTTTAENIALVIRDLVANQMDADPPGPESPALAGPWIKVYETPNSWVECGPTERGNR